VNHHGSEYRCKSKPAESYGRRENRSNWRFFILGGRIIGAVPYRRAVRTPFEFTTRVLFSALAYCRG
jgi:hypothetical protein